MPHSTTGTTSYVLVKYSRAYPTKRVAHSNRLDSQNVSELASEWQHFTNPTIRLVLDVKSTANGGIESVRLRILWQIDSEQDSGKQQQDVVFEDLDLLSFSSDVAFNTAGITSMESLPLKAVYRGTVVGIRYLHSRDSETVPNYRRLQISFRSVSEASEFIESIKPVCPCKMNPTPVQVPQNNATIQSQNVSRFGNLAAPQQTLRPLVLSSTQPQRVLAPATDHTRLHSSTAYTLSSPLDSARDSHGAMLSVSSSQIPSASARSLAPIVAEPASQAHSQTHSLVPSFDQGILSSCAAKDFAQTLASSLPPSSCSAAPTQNPTEPGDKPNQPATTQNDMHPILVSLMESTSIYNLPTPTLERIVGEVIREDGFIHLVERLSKMFTIRRVANI